MKRYRVETENGSFLGVIDGKRAFKSFLENFQKCNSYVKKEDCVLVEVKQSKKVTYTIYSSYDMYIKENMEQAKENILDNVFYDCNEDGTITVTDNYGKEVTVTREEYSKTITEEKLYDECNFNNQIWAEDTQMELKHCDRGELVAIADLGRWNGLCSGYKIIKSLPDVLYTSCDDEELYVDSNGDLHKSESHHDGSNSILYRYWKEGLSDKQKENFLNKIYKGNCSQKDITRYTRKAGVEIAEFYGWKIRGAKKVA